MFWPIFIWLLDQIHWCPLIYAQNFKAKKGLMKLHNPHKFLEDSISSSHLRDSQSLVALKPEAIIFGLFWVVFSLISPAKEIEFVQDFYQACTARLRINYVMVFNVVWKILDNETKKLIFWLILTCFLFLPSYTLQFTPQTFNKWKILWRYMIIV